jgi:hypothetical protein
VLGVALVEADACEEYDAVAAGQAGKHRVDLFVERHA